MVINFQDRLKRISCLLSITLPFCFSQPVWAQTAGQNNVCQEPLNIEMLQKEPQELAELGIVTADTLYQEDISVPSLWWAKDQFARGKLLKNWIAHTPKANQIINEISDETPNENSDDSPEVKVDETSEEIPTGRIDLIVNRQIWSNLEFIKQYGFVNKFGTVARQYKYNLRIFNQQQRCLASYTCQFGSSPEEDSCEIKFHSLQGGFQL